MQQLNVIQGSDEWLAAREGKFTGSLAPQIMGDGYESRDKAIPKFIGQDAEEVSHHLQKIFDEGHAAEAEARPYAEHFMGDSLSPLVCVAEIDGLPLLASLDGITFSGEQIWEHKHTSKEFEEIPPLYFWQLEHNLLVSGAGECLLTITQKQTGEKKHFWYESIPERRKALIAGWKQFAIDVEAYKTKLANGEIKQTVQAQAEVLLDLPAITYEMNGLALTSNFDKFKEQARELIKKSREPLVTDDDFATAESLVKVFKSAEEKLSGLSEQVIGEVSDIDAFIKELKQVSEGMRQARLATEKLVTAEKQNRRQEIINKAQHDLNNHIQAQQAKLDGYALPAYRADFAGALKGKKTIESLQSAANDCLANAKIAISQQADEGAANLKAFNELAVDHKFLFADLQQNLFKPADDFTAMVKSRIADHKEEERIRAEKAAERTVEPAKQPEPEPEELPLAAETTSQPTLKQQVNAVMDNKKPGGKLSGIVNADLLDAEINSIVRYMTDERYPLSHLKAIASIVYAFNESEESEKEIFAFADSIKKKYGVAA